MILTVNIIIARRDDESRSAGKYTIPARTHLLLLNVHTREESLSTLTILGRLTCNVTQRTPPRQRCDYSYTPNARAHIYAPRGGGHRAHVRACKLLLLPQHIHCTPVYLNSRGKCTQRVHVRNQFFSPRWLTRAFSLPRCARCTERLLFFPRVFAQ